MEYLKGVAARSQLEKLLFGAGQRKCVSLRTARQGMVGPGTEPAAPQPGHLQPGGCVCALCWPEVEGEGKELSSSLPSCL